MGTLLQAFSLYDLRCLSNVKPKQTNKVLRCCLNLIVTVIYWNLLIFFSGIILEYEQGGQLKTKAIDLLDLKLE